MPKVRAVTYFISASSFDLICASAEAAVSFFDTAIAELKRDGHGLQMVRIATNTCEQWLDQDADVALAQLKEFDALCSRIEQRVGGGVAVIASLGNVHERLDDGVLVRALASTEHLFVCLQARHSAEGLPDVAHARRCAQLLLDLNDATRSTRGEIRSGPLSGAPYAFKLTVVCNTEPGGPFFPGAFSPAPGMTGRRVNPPDSTWSTPAFAFACENSDLLVRAFGAARAQADALPSSAQPQTAVLGLAAAELEREFDGTLRQLDQLGMALEALSPGVTYAGCDPSVASAAHPEESIVNAFDSIGLGPFGGAGTLTLSALVTSVLKRMPYRLVGYCGLSARAPSPPPRWRQLLAALPLRARARTAEAARRIALRADSRASPCACARAHCVQCYRRPRTTGSRGLAARARSR